MLSAPSKEQREPKGSEGGVQVSKSGCYLQPKSKSRRKDGDSRSPLLIGDFRSGSSLDVILTEKLKKIKILFPHRCDIDIVTSGLRSEAF